MDTESKTISFVFASHVQTLTEAGNSFCYFLFVGEYANRHARTCYMGYLDAVLLWVL